MILPVCILGSPILKKIAVDIDKNYPNLQELINNMYDTMYNSDGLGLAAPQVEHSIRLFVIDGSPLKDDEPEIDGFKRIFINAHIIEYAGEETLFTEGCLSVPGLREDVKRPSKIRIQYYDENWNYYDEYFEGVKARIIQHEYDHLEGILFTDKLSILKKRLLKGKLLAITKGRFDASYRVKVSKSL